MTAENAHLVYKLAKIPFEKGEEEPKKPYFWSVLWNSCGHSGHQSGNTRIWVSKYATVEEAVQAKFDDGWQVKMMTFDELFPHTLPFGKRRCVTTPKLYKEATPRAREQCRCCECGGVIAKKEGLPPLLRPLGRLDELQGVRGLSRPEERDLRFLELPREAGRDGLRGALRARPRKAAIPRPTTIPGSMGKGAALRSVSRRSE